MESKSIKYKKNKDKVWVLLNDGNVIERDNTNIVDKEIYYESVIAELKNKIRLTKKRSSDMECTTVVSFLKMMSIIYGSALIYNLTHISFLYFLLGVLVSSVYGYKIYKSVNTKKLLDNITKELKVKLDSQNKELEEVKKQEVIKVNSKNEEIYKVDRKSITRTVNEPYYIAKNNYIKTRKRVLTKKVR